MGSELVFNFSNLTEKSVGDNGISDRLINSLSGKAHDIHSETLKQSKKKLDNNIRYQKIIINEHVLRKGLTWHI